MNKNDIPFILTSNSLTVVFDNKPFTMRADNPNFSAAKDALKDNNLTLLKKLFDIVSEVKAFGEGKFEVKNGQILYNGWPVVNNITNRILQMIKDGFDCSPMINFLNNIDKNPDKTVADELYKFLEANELPITANGCFLAYKRIQSDDLDFYTKSIKNEIGKEVRMPREKVVRDPNQTCSFGYHVCSRKYLDSYYDGEGKIVLVAVDPSDVVSVPTDYQNTKMRVCAYTPIRALEESIVDKGELEKFECHKSVYNYHNTRDSKGRFCKKNR